MLYRLVRWIENETLLSLYIPCIARFICLTEKFIERCGWTTSGCRVRIVGPVSRLFETTTTTTMALTLLRTMGRSPCFKQRSLNILTSPGLKPGFRSSATRHHSTSHLTTTSTSQLDLPNLLRFARSVPRAVRNTYFASRPSASGGGKGPSSFFHGFRRRVDALPTNVILYGIVGINAGVFLLWYDISSLCSCLARLHLLIVMRL